VRACLISLLGAGLAAAGPVEVSGVFPHLAMFNDEGECGTGAVVPWADRLWVITYGPHLPRGSSDKLYEITPELEQIVRPESIGGTPANRMIHPESGQLFIGPYAIDSEREVRVIPYSEMFGRHTGNARHLGKPAEKVLYATMEEGFYEVDVESLEVTELWADEAREEGRRADLPGYHGKGFYSGQGVYVYANNGEHGRRALEDPMTPSGVLAEWDGEAEAWTVVRRDQFTEVTGPGGIRGNPDPASDPIWAVGWDAKSLLLGVRMPDSGWSFYRLPKSSHSYDGAHGWNTEWPRIREIGEEDLLMTMHGALWRFPKDFRPGNSAGIAPRSNYLKVIGDFARWRDRIVFGCDDTARKEFLNKRAAKAEFEAPRSQSNLWFVEPRQLDGFGPALGRGAVWLDEPVKAGVASDPFLFSGYERRMLWLANGGDKPLHVRLEVDRDGDGEWSVMREVVMRPGSSMPQWFGPQDGGAWLRVVPLMDGESVTAAFSYREEDDRSAEAAAIFAALAAPGGEFTGGQLLTRGDESGRLSFAAVAGDGSELGYYELDGELKLRRVEDAARHAEVKEGAPIPAGVLEIDEASVVYTDDEGHRWRLPKGPEAMDEHPLGPYRVAREVATERDLFNAHGTFYELPARNAGGFAKVRPVATHERWVHDYASFRGLFVISGVAADAEAGEHVVRSEDGEAALWVGAIDDLWELGKPRGVGGPWSETRVDAGEVSDPYLLTGYDEKSLTLESDVAMEIVAEVDVSGDGDWVRYRSFEVGPEKGVKQAFPESFSGYWIRFRSGGAGVVTARLRYR